MQERLFDPWVRKIPGKRKWQLTPVFLPGKAHGQRSLAGYSPWGHKESDPTERPSTITEVMDILFGMDSTLKNYKSAISIELFPLLCHRVSICIYICILKHYWICLVVLTGLLQLFAFSICKIVSSVLLDMAT